MLDKELLNVPGFIGELMDYYLRTAAYPNEPLALCAALSMQALLAGRKVQDSGGLRTNLYILGLAKSGVGKDWARKINVKIMHQIGKSHLIGNQIGSGQGLEDAMVTTPAMLFQTDEINSLIRNMAQGKESRFTSIHDILREFYSSASSIYSGRKLAKQESVDIDQPCLCLYGTATPKTYYKSMNEELMVDGFFSRLIVVEGGERGLGRRAKFEDIPDEIMDIARWWNDYLPGTGNLEEWAPRPRIIEASEKANKLLDEHQAWCDEKNIEASRNEDEVGTAVWTRAHENVRKVALTRACSDNHREPLINEENVSWSWKLIDDTVMRSLQMANGYVGISEFDLDCNKTLAAIMESANFSLSRRNLLRKCRKKSKELDEIVKTLLDREQIVEKEIQAGHGRAAKVYEIHPEDTTRRRMEARNYVDKCIEMQGRGYVLHDMAKSEIIDPLEDPDSIEWVISVRDSEACGNFQWKKRTNAAG